MATSASLGVFGRAVPELVRAYAPLAPRGTALDVGCGRGHATAWLAAQGFDALGLDAFDLPDAAACAAGARFARADAAAFAYAEASPSVIVARHVLQFLPPEIRDATLRAMALALIPGGLLIVESFTDEDPSAQSRAGASARSYFAASELGRQLIAAGGLSLLYYREALIADDHEPVGAHAHGVVAAVARRDR